MFAERRQIVDRYRRGTPAVLITLVGVEGSSYRRVGARLLLDADGGHAGSISGGCLEAELLRKAQWLTRAGAVVERYSTLFDDTAEIPYGLGCGGTVDLLLEPAHTPECDALIDALENSRAGEECRIATQLPTAGLPLRRCVLTSQGTHIFRSAQGLVDPSLPFFAEQILPPPRLVIAGAGDDAQPLVRMAAMLGWRTLVIDGRAQWARAERFPEADEVQVANADAAQLAADDAVVIMTHSYEQDRAWLTTALASGPRYLGLLGARHRSALLVAEAAAMLGWELERACEGLFAPVGLDLGGDGPEAIALAIVAEVQAAIEGRVAAPQRMTPTVVAEQIARGGASRYLQTECAL
jgi:xanthine/CO dehydrogenase XdhC/CoxF family maturation factor